MLLTLFYRFSAAPVMHKNLTPPFMSFNTAVHSTAQGEQGDHEKKQVEKKMLLPAKQCEHTTTAAGKVALGKEHYCDVNAKACQQ